MYTISSSLSDTKIISGDIECLNKGKVCEVFSDDIIDFFSDLSKEILKNKDAKEFSDLITFAFFCRRASLSKLKKSFKTSHIRIGWGSAIHITPSNVPINTAYSFLFSSLSGNINVLRIPSNFYPQLEIFFNLINNLCKKNKYKNIKNTFCFIQTPRNGILLKEFLNKSDIRIVWGGDNTVTDIRSIHSKPGSIELAFPDRKSICIIDAQSISVLTNEELNQLTDKFYNDTLLIDQNACSSPTTIIWFGKKKTKDTSLRFWDSVRRSELRNGPIGVKKYIDKMVNLANEVQKDENLDRRFKEFGLGTTVQRSSQKEINHNLEKFNLGRYLEYEVESLEFLENIISKKTQTITYYGINPKDISELVIKHGLKGIDRIVPIGNALDMGLIWDGKDLVKNLSRIISIY